MFAYVVKCRRHGGYEPMYLLNCPRFQCRVVQMPVSREWLMVRCLDATCLSNGGLGVKWGPNVVREE